MELRQDPDSRYREVASTGQPANPVSLVRLEEGGEVTSPKARKAAGDHYEIAIGRWKAEVITATASKDAGLKLRKRRRSEAGELWERRRMRRMRQRIAARRRDRHD